MPDDHPGSSHVSLRVPNDVLAAFDRLAAELERPRSWVMLRALRCYLEEEGAEIIEDGESIAELDRGEVVTSEEMEQRLQAIFERGRKARAQEK
jgi:predicted transcriptional regulator